MFGRVRTEQRGMCHIVEDVARGSQRKRKPRKALSGVVVQSSFLIQVAPLKGNALPLMHCARMKHNTPIPMYEEIAAVCLFFAFRLSS